MGKQRKSKSSPALKKTDDIPVAVNGSVKDVTVNGFSPVKSPIVNNNAKPSVQVNGDATPARPLVMREKAAKAQINTKTKETENNTPGFSLAVLLTQSLMANDINKVDSVLRENKLEVINSTLRDLPVAQVIPLLKFIESRLRAPKAQEVRQFIRWLHCTLAAHMGYLVTQRNLNKELGGLLQWMRERTQHYNKLLVLQGKLGVIAEQIEKRSNNSDIAIHSEPLILFNNDDDLDSDHEDLETLGSDDSGASSQDDWWDEGEKELGLDVDEDDDDDEDDDMSDSDQDAGTFNKHSEREESSDDDSNDDDDDEDEMDLG